MIPMNAIVIDKLSFYYDQNQVLSNIDLAICRGSFTGVLGPNGCGKTTLLRNISGYLKPQKGSVKIMNRQVINLGSRERAKLVAYIPQNANSEFDFSVYQTVMMGRLPYLRPLQRESRADRDIVIESMRLTDVLHLKDRPIGRLSGGERQRVLIARALAQKTPVLLMDEPVSHLDIKYKLDIVALIPQLCESLSITAVAVFHDIALAARFCSQTILMKDGRIVSAGDSSSVLTRDSIEQVFGVSVDMLDLGRLI